MEGPSLRFREYSDDRVGKCFVQCRGLLLCWLTGCTCASSCRKIQMPLMSDQRLAATRIPITIPKGGLMRARINHHLVKGLHKMVEILVAVGIYCPTSASLRLRRQRLLYYRSSPHAIFDRSPGYHRGAIFSPWSLNDCERYLCGVLQNADTAVSFRQVGIGHRMYGRNWQGVRCSTGTSR